MAKRVEKMTNAELAREARVLKVWIRDAKAAKQARIADIAAELARRSGISDETLDCRESS